MDLGSGQQLGIFSAQRSIIDAFRLRQFEGEDEGEGEGMARAWRPPRSKSGRARAVNPRTTRDDARVPRSPACDPVNDEHLAVTDRTPARPAYLDLQRLSSGCFRRPEYSPLVANFSQRLKHFDVVGSTNFEFWSAPDLQPNLAGQDSLDQWMTAV